MSETDNRFKVIFLGESGVGKTTLLLRFWYGQFILSPRSTIGVEFHTKKTVVEDQTITLYMIDTAGQERFRASIPPIYFRHASAAVVVYDTTNSASFKQVKWWIKHLRTLRGEDVIIMLTGNKTDISPREVSTKEGKRLAKQLKVMFTETSCKTGDNVEHLFDRVATELVRHNSSQLESSQIHSSHGFDPHRTEDNIVSPERIIILANVSKVERDASGCCIKKRFVPKSSTSPRPSVQESDICTMSMNEASRATRGLYISAKNPGFFMEFAKQFRSRLEQKNIHELAMEAHHSDHPSIFPIGTIAADDLPKYKEGQLSGVEFLIRLKEQGVIYRFPDGHPLSGKYCYNNLVYVVEQIGKVGSIDKLLLKIDIKDLLPDPDPVPDPIALSSVESTQM